MTKSPAQGSPAWWLATLRCELSGWELPGHLFDHEVRLEHITAVAGEPALMAMLLAVEAYLPEPFPHALLDQMDSLGELLDFAEVKRRRGSGQ